MAFPGFEICLGEGLTLSSRIAWILADGAGGVSISLTSHLDTPSSPIRLFLEDAFPVLQGRRKGLPLPKELTSLMGFGDLPPCCLQTLAPKSNQGTIGTAVDYRLRYCFGSYRSYDTVAAHGVGMLAGRVAKAGKEFLKFHDDLVARINPLALSLSENAEAALDASCVVMAWFEQIRRTRRLFPEFDVLLKKTRKPGDLLAAVQLEVVRDVGQLAVAFEKDAAHLFKPGPTFNPTFTGGGDVGGADADIIVDKTLIEFKCTASLDAAKLRAAALQMLGYILLDYEGRYDVSQVMVYLPRQRYSWSRPLWQLVLPPSDVATVLGRGSMDGVDSEVKARLQRLRSDFRRVAGSLGQALSFGAGSFPRFLICVVSVRCFCL